MSEIAVLVALAFIAGGVVGAIIASIVKATLAAEQRSDTIRKLERKAEEAYRQRGNSDDYQSGRASGLESAIMLLSWEGHQ